MLAEVLRAAGIAHPSDGRPLSEDLLFGIAGGIGFCYFVFEYPGWTSLYVSGSYNALFFEKKGPVQLACERLGIPVRVRQTASPGAAGKHLREALASAPLVALTVDPTHFGLDVPDPLPGVFQQTVAVALAGEGVEMTGLGPSRRLSWDELGAARAATGPARNRLFAITPPSLPVNLETAVRSAIANTVSGLLQPSMTNFGVPGMRKWVGLLTDTRGRKGWPTLFAAAPDRALRWTRFWLAGPGTGGSACRVQYGAFLREAATVLKEPTLAEIAAEYEALGGEWQRLLGRPDPTAGFGAMASDLSAIADHEQAVGRRLAALFGA